MVISVFCRDSVDRCLLMDELLLFRGMVAAWAVVGVSRRQYHQRLRWMRCDSATSVSRKAGLGRL